MAKTADFRELSALEVNAVAGAGDGSVNGSFPPFAPPGWKPWTPFVQVFGRGDGLRLYRESRNYYPPLH